MTQYNRLHSDKNCKTDWEISAEAARKELAAATFSAFLPYISNKYWGVNKRHKITKSVHVAFHKWCEQKNSGVDKPKIIIRHKDGTPWKNVDGEIVYFKYYQHWKSQLYSESNVERAIAGIDWDYFMSPGRAGKKMLYIDADDHKLWQDDLDDAITLLKDIFKDQPFWRYSPGGYNGWLKIGDAPSVDDYNAGLARLDRVLKDTFAQRKIKTDIEIKGRSAWKDDIVDFEDRRSHLAKLPYYNHEDAGARKDADDCWNQRRLDEFIAKPDVHWKSLMAAVDQLERMLDPVKVEEGKRYLDMLKKHNGKVVEQDKEKPALKVPEVTSSNASSKSADADLEKDTPLGLTPVSSSLTIKNIRSISDAFQRQWSLVWWLHTRLGRKPTVNECLDAYKANNLFGGTWEDGLQKRTDNFRSHIEYIEQIWDDNKVRRASRADLDKEIKKWRGRMTSRLMLGKTYSVTIYQTTRYDEYGNRVVSGGRRRYVSGQHLSYVMGIVSYVMATSKLGDGSIRRKSIQGWWEDLAEEGKLPAWSAEYWLSCRQALEDIGWIVVDNTYSHRSHRSKTAKITYTDQPLVGTVCSHPSFSFVPSLTFIVVTHSSPENGKSDQESRPRPPPRGQPPPIVRFIPSKQEQNSWN